MSDKNSLIQPDRGQKATDIHLVSKATLDDWVKQLSTPQRAALAAQKFEGGGYDYAIVPDGDHWFVVSGVANPDNLSSWCMAKLAEVLPAGTYRRAGGDPGKAAFGWITGQYRFDRYKSDAPEDAPRILLTKEVKAIDAILAEAAATELNIGFVSRMTRGRPWVRMKAAASLDGRTALASGESQWITGEAARVSRTTVGVARLGRGALVEIDRQAGAEGPADARRAIVEQLRPHPVIADRQLETLPRHRSS